MPEATPGAVPFQEAIDYFRGKVDLPTRAWTDLKEGAHARAFVVAGATSDKLLADLRGAVDAAISDGETLADFRKRFDTIVEAHGWSYKGGRDWRTRVIFDTNCRMARAAGRWAQIERQNAREKARGRTLYLRYVAVMDERTRPEHRRWHGLIRPADDPIWRTITPPNGWMCRCTIETLTERDLKRYGYQATPDDQLPDMTPEPRQVTLADGSTETWPTPPGIDTGFGYNVGEADSWLRGAAPPELRQPLPPPQGDAAPAATAPAPALPALPAPRPLPGGAELLPDGLADEDYIREFLRPFGADLGQPKGFRDAAGHLVAVGDDLFIDRAATAKAGHTVWKVEKNGRHQTLPLIAHALRDPDEIWLDWFRARGGWVLRRRYVRRFEGAFSVTATNERGKHLPPYTGALSVMEWTADGWTGRTLFPAQGREDHERHGVLLWRRK